jgi:hypothetical protein
MHWSRKALWIQMILGLILVFSLNFLTACGKPMPIKTGPTKVLCLGDSITYGLDGNGYRKLLFETLGANYPDFSDTLR